MRPSILPFLCVVMASGLSACDLPDEDPASPSDFEFRNGPPQDQGYLGNGDITVTTRDDSDDGDGGDIVLFVLNDNAVFDRVGELVAYVEDDAIYSGANDQMLCTRSSAGQFSELYDVDGALMYSTKGVWAYVGKPDFQDLDPPGHNAEFLAHLLGRFQGSELVDGPGPASGALAQASEAIQHASQMRKLVIVAMVDGACGGETLEDAGQ